jgi:hypothetical protein
MVWVRVHGMLQYQRKFLVRQNPDELAKAVGRENMIALEGKRGRVESRKLTARPAPQRLN